jgi:hypothetical protein
MKNLFGSVLGLVLVFCAFMLLVGACTALGSLGAGQF